MIERLRAAVVALLRPSPSPPRFAIALSAGITMLLAVGIPAVLGRTEIGLLASSGALSALYLTSRSRAERVRRLPFVQLGLLASLAAGAATRGEPLPAGIVLVVVAVGAVVLNLGFGLGPPGALFPVLAAGIGARLTLPRGAGGAGLDPVVVVLWAAAGAALAFVIVVAPLLLPQVRRSDAERQIAPVRFALDGGARIVIARVAVGVTVAAVLTAVLGLERGYWAAITVVAVLQTGRTRRVTGLRAVHRILGTLVGALLFIGVAAVLGLPAQGVGLALALGILQFAIELVIVAHYGLALVFVTPLALLIAEAGAAGDPWAVAGTRIVDTAIGCVLAVAILAADRLLTRAGPRPAP